MKLLKILDDLDKGDKKYINIDSISSIKFRSSNNDCKPRLEIVCNSGTSYRWEFSNENFQQTHDLIIDMFEHQDHYGNVIDLLRIIKSEGGYKML